MEFTTRKIIELELEKLAIKMLDNLVTKIQDNIVMIDDYPRIKVDMVIPSDCNSELFSLSRAAYNEGMTYEEIKLILQSTIKKQTQQK